RLWDGDLDAWKARGLPVRVYKTMRARELWDQICYYAWDNGEPGVVFLERYNKESNVGYCEKIISVNPCGEQGLGAYGVCNLGAINLVSFVRLSDEGEMAWFDYDRLKEVVALAVRFLDNVIDLNYYFMPENERQQKRGIRRIGLG